MGVNVYKLKVKSLVESEHDFEFPEFIFRLRKCYGTPRSMVCQDTGIGDSRLVNLEAGSFSEFPSAEILLLSEYYKVPCSLLNRKAKEFTAGKFVEKSRFRRLMLREKRTEKIERDAV